jgi:hypothetical protein
MHEIEEIDVFPNLTDLLLVLQNFLLLFDDLCQFNYVG